MARNGSGTYVLPSGNPVVTGSVVSSTWANNTLNDIATALTGSLSADGQTNPTGALTMAGFNHTNVGNATLRTQYLAAGQFQDSTAQYLTGVAGTNVITATAGLGMSAYVTGQVFRFIAAGANTGATTLNINSIGAIAITKNGTVALAAGDILSGSITTVVYDGTQFQLNSSVAVLSSNNTWTGTNTFSGPLMIPYGATASRPAGVQAEIYLNTTTGQYEGNKSVAGASISTITNVTTTATLTTATNHGLSSGAYVTVSGATPAAYNGTFQITVTGLTTFTYVMASNPGGSASVVGSYVYGQWASFGGATGGGSDQVFYENSKTITTNYTISSGKNAMTTGPVTINSGITVTVPSGSRWVVL